ncbi:hypothetical protein [uncultured Psychroserpens sp.]|uniref:hypothetical protein n=1 Tax=uncultured Psychroserpens sp. TaxID=255436 RepID=UPI002616E463|nr:hypothetical protein [uncultured Psychroserpens sp.]
MNATNIDIYDFNFLIGKWTVLNKKLKERLNNCNEWTEFQAEMQTKPFLNGLGLMDEMKSSHFGDDFIGFSIRMVNPKTNSWTIYWADTAHPENYLKEQVVGEFKNGIGEFYGEETYEGRSYKLRFTWTKPSENTALWKQAYFDEKNSQWETNWIMEFTKMN